ncbi:MAG TPA: PLP-dependent aspartate aminotransferase family protein [Clostridiaceae bacterium]
MDFGTKLIHNGNEIDKNTGALSVPIYQTSTFHQEDIDNPPEFEYARSGNPTRKALESTMAILENGDRGFAFSSGMAAVSSILAMFKSGDHIIVGEDVYGGTYRVTSKLFINFGLKVSFVNTTDLKNVVNSIEADTKAIFLETPSNPLLKITDLKGAIKIAKEKNILVVVDNTFLSPYIQRPLDLGPDIVWHSATKFLGGHSDVVAGIVVTAREDLSKRLAFVQNTFGAILGPQDSWLLLRGIKTLKVRLDYQCASAEKVARWLSESPYVSEVYYPGLLKHEGRDIHFGQASKGGAVLSFKAKDVSTAKKFMSQVKLAAVAVSLGGVETIVSYPVKMSHATVAKEEREKLGITDELIRISVGLEDTEDLISDFGRAFK